MTTAALQIPDYVTGTWAIDSVHSEVSFVVRHMMVSKVRGRFDAFDGTFTTAADPLQSTVTATVDLSSVNTGNETRDNHIRSEDFFHIEKHPAMTFRSTGLRPEGGNFLLDGDLTLHGVTKQVTFSVDGPSAPGKDPWGNTRIGLSATTKINRKDFGLNWNAALEAGGILVGEDVHITVEAEFTKA